jgi:DNA-binding transcriptional regulator YbjK
MGAAEAEGGVRANAAEAGEGAVVSAEAGERGDGRRANYRRSAGSPRGQARRQELLDRVTDDLAANGLVDFSLRRAARAAGTTHKVLLYYFDGADDLLEHAMVKLRERRVTSSLAAVEQAQLQTLAGRVRAVWSAVMGAEFRVLGQSVGLTMYDPERYSGLGVRASEQYMTALLGICPADWSQQRKREVSEMIMAVLRGYTVEFLTSGDSAAIEAGFAALDRALEREEAASD